jgi:hypothetical protein
MERFIIILAFADLFGSNHEHTKSPYFFGVAHVDISLCAGSQCHELALFAEQ